MVVVQVAVPVPLRQTFSYLHTSELPLGVRVRVPFGRRALIGVVMQGHANQAAIDESKLKPIEAVLDETPVLDDTLVTLCHWLSRYYHHPIGEVVSTALPVLLRKGEAAEPKNEPWVYLTTEGEGGIEDVKKRAPKQFNALTKLVQGPCSKTAFRELADSRIFSVLQEKGFIELKEAPLEAKHTQGSSWLSAMKLGEKPIPNKEQSVAIAAINLANQQFSPFLIEGVTGSGKTEVYLQAIEPVVMAGKQVLILVPEIGLTPQTVSRFEQRFGVEVGVLHSQLTDTARLGVWQKAKAGELAIIIGTRSAIFTPMKQPGMLIVDEEHDESYKQQDGLRYHARDFAVMRAQHENIPLLLGSATPSLETLNNALNKRYQHLILQQRAAGAAHTQQHILDMRDQPLHSGVAEGMLRIMRQHLEMGNQVLVFLNRRGFAPAMICQHCGESVMCRRCDKPYTVHKHNKGLQCHHCGGARPIPTECPSCHGHNLQPTGMGTERLEQGLTQLFPNAKQVRIDSDAVRGKDKLTRLLDEINQRKYQLLIGTQILSKGHHFPHVTLVVILDSDGALFSADFRASEKLAQLVTQLAGRAGRASKPGEMWLQSYNPGHPLLQDLTQNGFAHFARHALLERKMAALPPFTVQIALRAESVEEATGFHFLQQAREIMALTDSGVNFMGPIPALIEKRQGRFRYLLVIQSATRAQVHGVLHRCLPSIEQAPLASKVRWSIDVDPADFS